MRNRHDSVIISLNDGHRGAPHTLFRCVTKAASSSCTFEPQSERFNRTDSIQSPVSEAALCTVRRYRNWIEIFQECLYILSEPGPGSVRFGAFGSFMFLISFPLTNRTVRKHKLRQSSASWLEFYYSILLSLNSPSRPPQFLSAVCFPMLPCLLVEVWAAKILGSRLVHPKHHSPPGTNARSATNCLITSV